jgi:hypothetical protein
LQNGMRKGAFQKPWKAGYDINSHAHRGTIG